MHTAVVNGTICAVLGHYRGGYTQHKYRKDWNAVSDCLKAADPRVFELGKIGVVKKLRDPKTKRESKVEIVK